jgi:hypothetical protein
MVFSLLLMTQVNVEEILISLGLLAIGVPVYAFFSPKSELQELKELLVSREAILTRAYHQGDLFLAYVVRRVKWRVYRARGIERAWKLENKN